jgi:hypothetical protein
MHYYIVMISYPRRVNGAGIIEAAGCQAIVDPEITYRNVVDRVRSSEYKNILFIHRYEDGAFEDVTEAVLFDADQPANELVRDNAQFGVGA